MNQHQFFVKGKWDGGREGQGFLEANGLNTTVSIPSSMNGLGSGTNPEELLLGASASCYMITLGLMLNKREIEVASLTFETEGILVEDPVLRYDRIIHRPTITLAQNDPELIKRVELLAIQAERNCMISAAIRGNVIIDVKPTVTVQE